MHIKKIKSNENQIFNQNIVEFHKVIELNEELLEFLHETKQENVKDRQVYSEFTSQTVAMLYQAMKNIIEGHMVIAKFCIRTAIETSCLAAYSLCNTEINIFYGDSVHGIVLKNIKNKVYDFCNQHSKEISIHFKEKKDLINAYYSHGNLFGAGKLDRTMLLDGYKHFEKDSEKIKEISLWEINEILISVIELMRNVAFNNELVFDINREKFFCYIDRSRMMRKEFQNKYNIF